MKLGVGGSFALLIAFAVGFAAPTETAMGQGASTKMPALPAPDLATDRSAALLPDGRWLQVGASNRAEASRQAILVAPGGVRTPLAASLNQARVGHSVTLLADGRVLVLGGFDSSGSLTGNGEIFDLESQQFRPLPATGLIARAYHAATVLGDGRVLITGGVSVRGTPVVDVELWSASTGRVERFSAKLGTPRQKHLAALLPTGAVLVWSGVGLDDAAMPGAEMFEPQVQRFRSVAPAETEAAILSLAGNQLPAVQTSTPSAEAKQVAGDRPLVILFNKRLDPASLNARSVTLIGPDGSTPSKVVPTEQGLLLFVWPDKELLPGSRYTLFINGAADKANRRLPLTAIGFDTAPLNGGGPAIDPSATAAAPQSVASADAAGARTPIASSSPPLIDAKTLAAMQADDELFVPDEKNRRGDWVSGRAERAALTLPRRPEVLEAVHGTALRQQALLDSRARALGLDLKSGQAVSAYDPVVVDEVALKTALDRKSPAEMVKALGRDKPRVRLEWSDTQESGALAIGRKAALSQVRSGGVTSVAGQVLRLNGKPLANVTLSVGGVSARTDDRGEFIISGVPSGPQVLVMDGRSANRGDAKYGVFQYRMDVRTGTVNALPFVVWMPKLDTRHAVRIDSPTRAETTITHPLVPGVEIVLPAGTVIRDIDGKIVTEISLTPIPVDQPPFPMPFFGVPVYYTLQPGGAVIQGVDGKPRAALVRYPNYTLDAPGTSMRLFDYDPHGRGWYEYSEAKVSAKEPSKLEADKPFQIYQLQLHSVSSGGPPGGGASPSGCGGGNGSGGGGGAGGWRQDATSGTCSAAGDPVDLSTGHFTHIERDLLLNDIVPIDVQRTYRTLDNNGYVRRFGVGSTMPYDTYLVVGLNNFLDMQLVMASGRVINFHGTTTGTYNQTYTNVDAIDDFRTATIQLVNSRFVLYFRDGRQWGFSKILARVDWMDDRLGNRTDIQRGASGAPVVRLVSPNGRWIEFTYPTGQLASQAQDHMGRRFSYLYDSGQRLTQVTDPLGKTRIYTWDTVNNRITSIQDPNGNLMVRNEYDANGRVKKQTLADDSTFLYAYVVDANGKVTQAEVTDRRGVIRRAEFDGTGNLVKNTFALGLPEQRVETFQYVNGLKTSSTDALTRRTDYEYDAKGNVTKVTRLAGTAGAVSTVITYDAVFNQPLTMKDANNNTTTFTYDAKGNLSKVIDALQHATTTTYDVQGKVIGVVDALNHKMTLAYEGADLVSVTDPLNRKVQYLTDAVGRVMTTINPLGGRSYQDWDALNRLLQISDVLGKTVKFGYDNNGNVLTQTDQRDNASVTTFNPLGKPATVKDPLLKMENLSYEPGGLIKQKIDRKGQLSNVTYDNLGRIKRIGFGATLAQPTAYKSMIELTWDAGDRLTQVLDKTCANPGTSLNCATVASSDVISRTWDLLDRLTKEVTPQGEVNYTYDNGGRRKTMIVKNGPIGSQTVQPTITYTWDVADRLTQISQAAGAVNSNVAQNIVFTYDNANRRTRTKLANGSTVDYSYDNADQITAITYKLANATVIGTLTYTYDLNGRRTSVGGTLARVNLPVADITDASYDAANRLRTWGGKSYSYDDNGNLIADGVNAYQWDERDRLKSITAGATPIGAFQYDSQNRRVGKTVGGATTGYVYDRHNFVQELLGTSNASPVKAQLLAGGIDETFLRLEGTARTSFLPDANNNTVRLLDATQAKVADYTYEAYGATTTDAANGNTQQFTGRENDNPGNSQGLYYYRARYYLPGCARFISEDPIGWAAGQTNGYAYVDGNPIDYRDPYGHIGTLGLAGLGAVIGGISAGIAAAQKCGSLKQIAAAAGAGALTGAVAGLTLGFGSSVLVGAAAGAAGDALGTLAAGDDFNFTDTATAGLLGAWGGGVGMGLGKLGMSPTKSNLLVGTLGLGMSLHGNQATGQVASGCQ